MPGGCFLHPEVTLTSKESDGLVQAEILHKRTPTEVNGERITSTHIGLMAHLAQVLSLQRDQGSRDQESMVEDQRIKSSEKSMKAGQTHSGIVLSTSA